MNLHVALEFIVRRIVVLVYQVRGIIIQVDQNLIMSSKNKLNYLLSVNLANTLWQSLSSDKALSRKSSTCFFMAVELTCSS